MCLSAKKILFMCLFFFLSSIFQKFQFFRFSERAKSFGGCNNRCSICTYGNVWYHRRFLFPAPERSVVMTRIRLSDRWIIMNIFNGHEKKSILFGCYYHQYFWPCFKSPLFTCFSSWWIVWTKRIILSYTLSLTNLRAEILSN